VVHAQNRAPKLREVLGVAAVRTIGRLHARSASRIIATNDSTAAYLARRGVTVEVEPNIVVEPIESISSDDGLLVMSGLLIDRKRPWIALQALARPELAGYRLVVVGDGPLRPQLESLVRQERLDSRVEFTGRVKREAALEILSRARALVHPAIREGSPWVVGEAAAAGVPSAVFAGTGADTTARLSANGSGICAPNAGVAEFAATVSRVAGADRPTPSDRWSEKRLPDLLDKWWSHLD
jgi:glycosyltransferase involved in cell wall biosynthesis